MQPTTNARKPGIVPVLALTVAAALAAGVGIAGKTGAQRNADTSLERAMVTARAHVDQLIPVTDVGERAPTKVKRPEAPREFVRDYRKVALRAAQDAGLQYPDLFVRQMAAESGFQPCVRSPAGAIGIAQIMPGTAASWNVDPYDAEQALAVAARNMARYERQLGSYRLALAAYNAGPNAVRRYGNRIPPYRETRNYVRVIGDRSVRLRGMSQVYRLPGGMRTGFATRLKALQADVSKRGGTLVVADGWRSYDSQLRLWNDAKRKHGGWQGARTWVAPPGCSNHNRGAAADLKGDLKLAHRLAPRHGLAFPMKREPWHVELRGIATQSS